MTLGFLVLRNLLLTLVIEAIVAVILNVKSFKDLLKISFVNIITNPLLTIIIALFSLTPIYSITTHWILTLIMEAIIFVGESFLFKILLDTKVNPFKLGIILNSTSFIYGLLIIGSSLLMK